MENSLETQDMIWLYGYAGKDAPLDTKDTLQIHSLCFDQHDTAIRVGKILSKKLTDNQISHRVLQSLEENGSCYLHIQIYSSGVHNRVKEIITAQARNHIVNGDESLPIETSRYGIDQ